jgi:hypothetical protein
MAGSGVCGVYMCIYMKIEPIESSETSANNTQTPGTYPKESKLHLKHAKT